MIYYITKYTISGGVHKGNWIFLEEELNQREFSLPDKFINLIRVNLPNSEIKLLKTYNHVRIREEKFLKLL